MKQPSEPADGRRFQDAPAEQRCGWTIKLRDGSTAQCGRRRKFGWGYCGQHIAMSKAGKSPAEARETEAEGS